MKNRGKRALFTAVILLAFLLGGCGGGGSSGTGATGGSGGSGGTGGTGGTIILDWDAPTTNADGTALTDLVGYKIYYGTASRVYNHSIDVGNVNTYTLTGLAKGQTYYAAVTAYDTSANESGYSNEFQGVAK
jgi:hypothetical protein